MSAVEAGNTRRRPEWRIGRRMIDEQLGFGILVWGAFVVVILGITLGIAYWGEITQSVWDPATQAARWYVAFVGGYTIYYYLPLFVTHGMTRAVVAKATVLALVVLSLGFGALMVAGYGIEAALYQIGDWPQEVEDYHLFNSAGEVHLIFIGHAMRFLVWGGVGAVAGAAFYRNSNTGWLWLVPAILLGTIGDIALGGNWGPERLVLGSFEPTVLVAVPVSIACFVGLMAILWRMVRDMPIQSKSA